MSLLTPFKSILSALGSLLYPQGAVCVCCGDMRGQEEGIFCPDCAAKYKPLYDSVQLGSRQGVERVYSACRYTSPASDAVKAFKFNHNGDAGRFMAQEMIRSARELGLPAPDAVVPVPLHWKRQYSRGFNQSMILARSLARSLDAPVMNLLKRRRNTKMQSTLNPEERLSNIRGAFTARRSCRGLSILLVDDVCTTGATANACAAALKQAGAGEVELFVFADAMPRRRKTQPHSQAAEARRESQTAHHSAEARRESQTAHHSPEALWGSRTMSQFSENDRKTLTDRLPRAAAADIKDRADYGRSDIELDIDCQFKSDLTGENGRTDYGLSRTDHVSQPDHTSQDDQNDLDEFEKWLSGDE